MKGSSARGPRLSRFRALLHHRYLSRTPTKKKKIIRPTAALSSDEGIKMEDWESKTITAVMSKTYDFAAATMALRPGATFADWISKAIVPQTQYSDDLTGMCYEAPTDLNISDQQMQMFGIRKCEYGCSMDGGSVQSGCMAALDVQAMQEVEYLALGNTSGIIAGMPSARPDQF